MSMKIMINGANGDGKPDSVVAKHRLVMMKSETQKMDKQKRLLEEELKLLSDEIEKLDKQLDDKLVCQGLFAKWSGIQVTKSDATSCNVSYSVSRSERSLGEYTIGFKKTGQYWQVASECLPYSMKAIKKRVDKAKIHSPDQLSLIIHELQHEVQMFVQRGEQLKEATSLNSDTVGIYPSVSSTSCLIELKLCDNSGGSDLSNASIYLTYLPHKFLPEQPQFKISGGDDAAKSALKNQLSCLEHLPLKEAIMSALILDDNSSMVSDEHIQHSEGSVSLSVTINTEDVSSRSVNTDASQTNDDVCSRSINTDTAQTDENMPTKGKVIEKGFRGRGRGRGRGMRGRPGGNFIAQRK